MSSDQIELVHLPVGEWQSYRELRLEALLESPQAFCSTYKEQKTLPDQFWQSRLEEAVRGESSWLLFARSGGRLVGMIGAYRVQEESQPGELQLAEIISVYVTPEARGRGVSRLLMRSMLDLLKEKGFRTVRLGVNDEQAAAVRLYRRFGFTTVETEPHLMGDGLYHDESVMQRTLD